MAYGRKQIRYNGASFKSKLEAHVAEAFDNLGLRWEYEPVTFCGSAYRAAQYTPDFYLPELNCYVEVTGTWNPNAPVSNGVDWGAAAEAHIECVRAFRETEGESWLDRQYEGGGKPAIVCVDGQGRISKDGIDWESFNGMSLLLDHCYSCGEWGFIDENGGWACPRCGAYDGNAFCDFHDNLFEAAGLKEYAERGREWAGASHGA